MIRPLYKAQAPFMEASRGFGYQGVVMYDDDEDKVQCHICGGWFGNLGQHTKRAHDVQVDDYKMEYGLSLRTALCSKKISAAHRKSGLRLYASKASGLIRASKKNLKRRRRMALNQINRQPPNSSMQVKNARALCDLQIRGRYEVVKKISGRCPTHGDFMKHDPQLYGAACARYGSPNKFRKWLGEKPLTKNEYSTIPDIDLIAALRRKRNIVGTPGVKHFKSSGGGYPHFTVFYRAFGSWANALRMAGIK